MFLGFKLYYLLVILSSLVKFNPTLPSYRGISVPWFKLLIFSAFLLKLLIFLPWLKITAAGDDE